MYIIAESIMKYRKYYGMYNVVGYGCISLLTAWISWNTENIMGCIMWWDMDVYHC